MAKSSRKRRRLTLARRVRHGATVPLLNLVRGGMAMLPHRAAMSVGRCAGLLAWVFSGGRRRMAIENLRNAGIGEDDMQRGRIVRAMFSGIGENICEALHATGWRAEQFQDRIRFAAPEIIEAAAGKGLLLVTGHVGNWELTPPPFRSRFDRPLTVLMASQRNESLNAWIVRQRSSSGVGVMMSDAGALKMVRLLRSGGLLALLADQDTTRADGIFVEFFGRQAYTPAGPARLARMSGVAIVVITIRRDRADRRRHTMQVWEPILPDPSAEADADIRRMTQAFTRQIEERIRQSPEDWVWLHDRWRHQPGHRIRVRSARRRRQAG